MNRHDREVDRLHRDPDSPVALERRPPVLADPALRLAEALELEERLGGEENGQDAGRQDKLVNGDTGGGSCGMRTF